VFFLNSDYNIQRESTLHLGNDSVMWTGMLLPMSILSALPLWQTVSELHTDGCDNKYGRYMHSPLNGCDCDIPLTQLAGDGNQ
jgi:hypothetical protein